MVNVRLLSLGALLVALAGCEYIEQFMGGGGLPEGVQEQVRKGDYPGANKVLAAKAAENPANVEVATYLAFTQMMAGDYKSADRTLAAAEPGATPEELPGLKLRRAVVALRAGSLDAVSTHALASGLPEGKLLAAEVHITELRGEPARELLRQIQDQPGVIGKVAKEYLDLLNGGSATEAVAEITAMWALGDRKTACEHAAEVVPEMPENDQKVELQILWANRAVTSGQVAVANTLISDLGAPPTADLAWRIQATRALIAIAEGRYEEGIRLLDQLEKAGAPADGLADARATAAALSQDPGIARQIVGDLESAAVARGLLQVGASDDASLAAPGGTVMKTFLEKK